MADIPAPTTPQALSVCTVQIGSLTSTILWLPGVQSATNSVRACDFIMCLPTNSIVNSLILVAHLPMRPIASGFLKMFSSGKLEGIVILCAWK
jgi:hypothetical protein